MSGCEKYTPGEFARGKNRLFYPADFVLPLRGKMFNPTESTPPSSAWPQVGQMWVMSPKKAFTPGHTPVAGEWPYGSIVTYIPRTYIILAYPYVHHILFIEQLPLWETLFLGPRAWGPKKISAQIINPIRAWGPGGIFYFFPFCWSLYKKRLQNFWSQRNVLVSRGSVPCGGMVSIQLVRTSLRCDDRVEFLGHTYTLAEFLGHTALAIFLGHFQGILRSPNC